MSTVLISDPPQADLRTPAWIPQWALVTGQLAHGASWLLLGAIGANGYWGLSFPGLAWVHLVALVWLTLIALAVMVHVLHGWLEVEWVAPRAARWSLLPFTLGALGMVGGFWFHHMGVLAASSGVAVAALAVYLTLALLTLARFEPSEDASGAVARAFRIVLTMLAATAGLGVAMAIALAFGAHPWILSAGPALHAHLGALGWLSLLVMGVSMHTVKPITGGRSPAIWRHIVATSLVVFGLAALAVGLAVGNGAAVPAGALLAGAGTVMYLVDMADILRRSKNTHRPPQAFVASSVVYFVAAAGLGAGVVFGRSDWQAAYAYLALMGWLGQMVNGHLYHIGIRVLATVVRGEDDETRPVQLLNSGLSWSSWTAFQLAVVAGTLGLMLQHAAAVVAAAVAGGLGWALMMANIRHAWQVAHRLPRELEADA